MGQWPRDRRGPNVEDALKHCNLIVLSREVNDPKGRLALMLELAEPETIILDATCVKGHEERIIAESGRNDV